MTYEHLLRCSYASVITYVTNYLYHGSGMHSVTFFLDHECEVLLKSFGFWRIFVFLPVLGSIINPYSDRIYLCGVDKF